MTVEELRGPHRVTVTRDVTMVTRDGKTLYADVYAPADGVDMPTLLRRTPYGKNQNDLALPFNEAHYYASHGYLTIVQNTRGRFGSEGAWYPFVYEANDGYDAVEWAAQQPGSSGRVGTFGQSYGALAQYLTASQRPPHLVTAVPVSAPLGAFENYWYNNGALELGWTLSYFMNMASDVLASMGETDRMAELERLKVDPTLRFGPLTEEALRRRPLSSWIELFGAGAPFLKDILHHASDGPYWWAVDVRRQMKNIDIPMLHVGSWYDIANWDTPTLFNGIRETALGPVARENQAMFMGPWAHLLPYSQPTSAGTGDIDFGPEAVYPVLDMQRAWFDHYVRDGRSGLPQAPVTIFVMGENAWRDESEWPLARAVRTDYHLRSGGSANTAAGDGRLTAEAPADEPYDTYRYDPTDPVPTAGGRFVGGGVKDQRHKQTRDDVLVYTSVANAEPVEVTGPASLTLFASTDAVDTDFIAVLSDVHPDGHVQNLSEGLVRLRFRDSYDEPRLHEPGELHTLTIELGNLSHVFKAGHRVRVHVTSSDFPRWDPNTNTGEPIDSAVTTVVAQQIVFHDAQRPSVLSLPVVPPSRA